MEQFQSDRTSVVDEDSSGRPTTALTADEVEGLNALVQEDRQITVTDVADKLDTSCGSVYSIIHKDLVCHKIYAR
jgi:hypothetical protein